MLIEGSFFHDPREPPRIHLAVMNRDPLLKLLSGEKRIESRFSLKRCVPHGRVSEGERIFFKEASGPVRATAVVCSVFTTSLASPAELESIRAIYGRWIQADDAFWSSKSGARWATLMGLGDLLPLTPFPVAKRDPRPWVVLEPDEGDAYARLMASLQKER